MEISLVNHPSTFIFFFKIGAPSPTEGCPAVACTLLQNRCTAKPAEVGEPYRSPSNFRNAILDCAGFRSGSSVMLHVGSNFLPRLQARLRDHAG